MTFSKVVIDGDQMIYACGFSSEGEPVSHTLRLLKNKLNQIIEDTGAPEYELVIEGKGNFREEIDFDYKANRTSKKPEHFEEMREYLINVWNSDLAEGMETDDVVSMRLWNDFVANDGDKERATIILSSPDKDLNNTPGWHYNPRTRETHWVTEEQAERHLWYQLCMGDKVDNIEGIPYIADYTREIFKLPKQAAKGCGAATAKKIMSQEDWKKAVMMCYADYCIDQECELHIGYDLMLEEMTLLWMVREVDELGEPVPPELDQEMFAECWKEVERGRSECDV